MALERLSRHLHPRLRSGVEDDAGQVHTRDAVHERMVSLGDDREASVFEALDHPQLPQRLTAVQAL